MTTTTLTCSARGVIWSPSLCNIRDKRAVRHLDDLVEQLGLLQGNMEEGGAVGLGKFIMSEVIGFATAREGRGGGKGCKVP